MVKINKNLKTEKTITFLDVSNIVNEYKEKHKDKQIISLGVGDTSLPIIEEIAEEMKKAVDELTDKKTFKGYGGQFGYDFLKKEILNNDYKNKGFTNDELYISNGTKTDITSILELFDINSKICILGPTYPIYEDGAKCLNRKVKIIEGTEEENFIPKPPKQKYDIIYICSPNNPTGIAWTHKELENWVNYAKKNESVILYDNVYTSFITSENKVKSIYEIDGAKEVAIEFRSFSKNASFTGVRCSYYIIPKEIGENINKIWKKRVINRFNGADYIAQRGAYKVYSKISQEKIKVNMAYYKENAKTLKKGFEDLNFTVYGGEDSPFLWIKTKNNITSLEYFKLLLEELNIVVIPSEVFSKNKHFFRVSALASKEAIETAIERIKKYYEKQII